MSKSSGSTLQKIADLAHEPGESFRRGVGRIGRTVAAGTLAARRRLISPLGHRAHYLLARGNIASQFTALGLDAPDLRFGLTRELRFGHDMAIERRGAGFDILVSDSCPDISLSWLRHRAACYIYWLAISDPEVKRCVTTLSDGDRPMTGQFAPSTNLQRVVAVPDPYFFVNRAFATFRATSERAAVPWHQRSAELVWRGAMTGTGLFDPELALERPWLAAQRIQVVARLRGVAGTDVKFSHSTLESVPIVALDRFGMRGDHVDETTWVGRKYALDIDGHTNTWQNLIVRLHLGCCVLKVASQYDYRQWYYDRLKPWEHYVPVRADCSDLLDMLEWVRANDGEASAIAARGQALARSLDWESACTDARALLQVNWDRPQVP